jgi:PIN domain nuclease of toxin-antitoxin system
MAGGLPMKHDCLLDTCAVLDLLAGGKSFSEKVCFLLEAPGSQVHVSAITAFEIGQKHAAGKLTLPCELARWFRAILLQHTLRELPLTSSICIAATGLPSIHKDPFDRLIIATALEFHLPIITSDRTIATYPGIKTLW